MAEKTPEFRYFKSVRGSLVPRYGTGQFIGAHRAPHGIEYTKNVVRIPADEVARYPREYKQVLDAKGLIELDEPAALAEMKAQEEAEARAADEAAKAQKESEQRAADEVKKATEAKAHAVAEESKALDASAHGGSTKRAKP